MQVGSLVTPRWNEEQMWNQIKARIPKYAHPFITNLPIFGQVYTIKTVGGICPCCGGRLVTLEEIVVVQIPPGAIMTEKGLYMDFYVEIDPPQENVQEIVNEVLSEGINPCRQVTPNM